MRSRRNSQMREVIISRVGVPFDGDCDESKYAREDEDGQRKVEKRTERVTPEHRPLAGRSQVLERLERHDECRHECVTRRKVDDVEVGDGSHVTVAGNGENHHGVA